MVHAGILAEDFVKMMRSGIPLIDTRSENEFSHASIPGAVNIPILNNSERHEVGYTYKNKGREEAVETGFRLVGPRFHEIISHTRKNIPGREVMVYCWRGGMRSQIMSWLLRMNGYRVITLKGGYKSFRNWALDIANRPLQAIILGGYTGSGKSELLKHIREKGEQVLDLEDIAEHKGSAFGALGKGEQPSNEHFENILALQWSAFDAARPVWIENESRSIGSCMLPEPLYNLMRNAPLVEIDIGIENRKKRILKEYGIFPTDVLAQTTTKIGKRLGPQHLKSALQMLAEGDMDGWLDIVLDYYDKLYGFGSSQRDHNRVAKLDLTGIPFDKMADEIICSAYEKFYPEKVIR
jgi:tRNA 2-selenouridine synthase